LSIFDVEVFADEETERAEGAEDQEEEGGKELGVKIMYYVVAEILKKRKKKY